MTHLDKKIDSYQNSSLIEQPKLNQNFHSLFYPKTIAIIGVSKNPLGGLKYYLSLRSSGFIQDGGRVFLINPKITQIMGEPVYSSLSDVNIPKPLDLVIIAVPAPIVPKIVLECNHIAKFGLLYSSGFGESGNSKLDLELKECIKQVDTRFVGPNGLGVLNPYSKIIMYPDWELTKGTISYVAQSGGTMARLYIYLGSLGLGFHNVVSIGNALDISFSELLNYFNEDPITKTIAFYLESLPNGREFMKIAKRVSKHKPIILWKGGQTQRGSIAALSHTGGLAGSYEVWKAMCRQSGIMLADHFELFADMVQVANICPHTPKNLNVGILVAGGGIGVEFTDIFEKAGLVVPEFDPKTISALAKLFPNVNTNFQNPVDTGEYGYDPRLFSQALAIILKDPNIGSIVFVREPERFEIISKMLKIDNPGQTTINSITEVLQTVQKPIFCNLSVNSDSNESFEVRHKFQIEMIQAGIPVINYFVNIPCIIQQLFYYGQYLDHIKQKK